VGKTYLDIPQRNPKRARRNVRTLSKVSKENLELNTSKIIDESGFIGFPSRFILIEINIRK
jgi:hypothetical protein